jgi:putative transposase
MRLTAKIKLMPTAEQSHALQQTLETANAACNTISQSTWATKTFRQFDLHRLCYADIRAAFGLSAQMTVRCIAKVADAYKRDREIQRVFKAHGAIAYDDRILSWNLAAPSVSIWTIHGRQSIPFVCGPRQWELLQTQRGETDLALVAGQWYLLAACEIEEPTPTDVEGALGVDFGIVNLATDSDGDIHAGTQVEKLRLRHQRRRDKLQAVGTRSAKRRLKKNAGKQRRFQADVNHCIAKKIVAKAKHTKRMIALEELTGIRTRVRVKGPAQRSRHGNWAFRQLRTFITYKARLGGVVVVAVDPRNTSRTCSQPTCGYCDKRNRVDQVHFRCLHCGYTTNADYNAARNIRDRAAISQPMVSSLRVQAQAQQLLPWVIDKNSKAD